VSLTGWSFPVLLAVLVAVAGGGLVAGWPRLSAPGWGHVAGRAGSLLGLNVLVLLLVGALMNAEFLFFASWTDLATSLTGQPAGVPSDGGGRAADAATTRVHGVAAVAATRLPPLPPNATRDRWLTYQVHGDASGLSGRVVVELPPGYTDPRQARVRYPVLETFAGYPGEPEQWVGAMNLGHELSDAVAARRLRPALVVSPQTEFPAGVDTECVDGTPGRPQVETWLAHDVPAWVARTFRVGTDRGSWTTIGLSAGGWCAAMVAMRHPAQFAAAIVMGGYFRPEFGPLYQPLRPGSRQAEAYDLVALARRAPPPVALWLQTSHADRTSYGSSAALLGAARPPLAVRATVLKNAGHRLAVWRDLLGTALTWLGADVPGFTPR